MAATTPTRTWPRFLSDSPRLSVLFTLLSHILIVLILWLPFGFKVIGIFEEWLIIASYQRSGRLLVADPVPATRPFVYVPFVIAQILTPDSFLGMNLLQALAILVKGIAAYWLLRQIFPKQRFLALAVSLLFMLYPVDDGLMTLRSLNVHVDVAVGVVLFNLFVLYWKSGRAVVWIGIWLLQIVTLGIYEVLFPIILLLPVLLVIRERRITRRVVVTSLLWSAIPLLMLIRIVLLFAQGGAGYAGEILDSGTGTQTTMQMLADYASSVLRVYWLHIERWLRIIPSFQLNSAYTVLALLAGLVTGVTGWHSLRQVTRLSWRQAGLLVGAGLLIMLLGFLLYLPTRYRNDDWRVFMVTSFGAALVLAVLLHQLASWWRLMGTFALGGFTVVATSLLLTQHQYYANTAFRLEDLLASIIRQAPDVEPDTVIVVRDTSGVLAIPEMLGGLSLGLEQALSYIYQRPMDAVYCYIGGASGEVCAFDADGMTHTVGNTTQAHISYEQLVLFETPQNGRVELIRTIPDVDNPERPVSTYDPSRRIRATAPFSERMQAIFTCPLNAVCFASPAPLIPPVSTRLEFDQFVPGIGWQAPARFFPEQSTQWMMSRRASLWLPLSAGSDLHISARVTFFLAQDVMDSLTLQVNRQDVPLSVQRDEWGTYIVSGTIPQSLLTQALLTPNAALNELVFSVDRLVMPHKVDSGPDYRTLGLLFDWLQISSAE